MSTNSFKNIYLRFTTEKKLEGFSGDKCAHHLPGPRSGKRYFGYISYELKDKIEQLTSRNKDKLGFPLIAFTEVKNKLSTAELRSFFSKKDLPQKNKISIRQRVSKKEYIATINKIKAHIQRGDIYEMNYCMEFYAENAVIDPLLVFEKLNAVSKAPFSSLLKLDDRYVISSSPERFLKRKGSTLISQPIKGTAPRGKTKTADAKIKADLKKSLKDRTENVMIVDLVRNDLSRVAKRSSVKVDELFGIYTFPQVHQMISTVSCELRKNTEFKEIIYATFPMGSMTGAPKVSAMELIEEFEKTKRGVYSGALGMIESNGDFDLSVVIRTILYDAKSKYLSFMVGSAITASSDPEKEYEECLLKAKGMMLALASSC